MVKCAYCMSDDYEYIRMLEQSYDDGVDEQFWECECNHCKKSFIIKEIYVMILDDCKSMTMERFNKGNY